MADCMRQQYVQVPLHLAAASLLLSKRRRPGLQVPDGSLPAGGATKWTGHITKA